MVDCCLLAPLDLPLTCGSIGTPHMHVHINPLLLTLNPVLMSLLSKIPWEEGGGEVPWFYTFKCNDHNSWTPWSICLILIGELGRTTEIFFNWFWDFNLRESIFKLKLFVLVNNSSIKGKMMKMSDFNM